MDIPITNSNITFSNHLDHFKARFGINRMKHLVNPGIYKLGNPDPDSRVFVSANYTLSFDTLRSALQGLNCYILVLDTKGINVWCAAGKGTFGTDELVRQIRNCELDKIISHKKIILPQLGAPGVSAHKVKELTGFNVKYGPIHAADIPEYLRNNKIPDRLRQVNFPLKDRVVLIPVELVSLIIPLIGIGVFLLLTAGLLTCLASISAIIGGTVLFPVLLPWLPTRDFSSKGFILGSIIALIFVFINFYINTDKILFYKLLLSFAYIFSIPSATAFISLNFTGSTSFTSKTGVRKEINKYFRVMVVLFSTGIIALISAIIYSLTGGNYV